LPASQSLFGDDRLLRDADQVASNDEIAWSTAFWYWRARVGINEQVKQGWFGTSTRLINGIECFGNQEKARVRFNIYKIVLLNFNVNETAIENGCYN
jgi:predicted chitinase